MTQKSVFYSFIRGTFHLKIDGGLSHFWVADASLAGSRNVPGSKALVLSVLYRNDRNNSTMPLYTDSFISRSTA